MNQTFGPQRPVTVRLVDDGPAIAEMLQDFLSGDLDGQTGHKAGIS